MALIKCPECGKDISDKASSCINCGYPISKLDLLVTNDDESFPNIPEDLGIGSQITNFNGEANVKLTFQGSRDFKNITNGKCSISLHKYGICIRQSLNEVRINRLQIVDIFTYKDSYLTDGNVIGKAVVGGLLFGEVGAIVGGMSGIQKQSKGTFLAITYWDFELKKKVTVSFLADKSPKLFVDKVKQMFVLPSKDSMMINPTKADDEIREKIENKKALKWVIIVGAVFGALLLLLAISEYL